MSQRSAQQRRSRGGDENNAAAAIDRRRRNSGLRLRLGSLAALASLLLLACFSSASAQPSDGPPQSVLLNSDEMRWVSLSANSTSAGATCNDGSVPGFWASLATPDSVDPASSLADLAAAGTSVTWSRRWVIYLESGGACVDAYSCELRAYDTPDHVTSYNSSRTKRAANLLSADQDLNPTAHDHHHVFG